YAHNIKSAKRVVERVRPEVWDVLEEVIRDRPVLLNRAPTLHRLGIQAFEPVLIDGSAIQIHPLVCTAFNADFDGDQMAVHVPLSDKAVKEARERMLSTMNLLSPSSGEPIVAPTLDMVLGCYYLTIAKPEGEGKGAGLVFADWDEAKIAYDLGVVDLQAVITVPLPESRRKPGDPSLIKTTVGRIIFNEVLPDAIGFYNEVMDKKKLKSVVADCYRVLSNEETAEVVDGIKRIGFDFATRSGVTIAISDITRPANKSALLANADKELADIEKQYRRGMITDQERYQQTIDLWNQVSEELATTIQREMDPFSSVTMMMQSGAKGNITQVRQMAGMRGLMTDPSGKIIELPIRSSFREGLSVLEYFISTHGARKGLADTALRTADSGYLTRRLIDVAQDVIVRDEDCGATNGIVITPDPTGVEKLSDKVIGRILAEPVADPATGEILYEAGAEVDWDAAAKLQKLNPPQVVVRSPLTCQSRHGVCRMCYGWSLGRGRMVDIGEAVGIIAAQSIGEPGTQLTMRTFHSGGIATVKDITSGLPRVEELFEARNPKGQAVISEIDGVVEVIRNDDGSRKIKVTSTEVYQDEHAVPEGYTVVARDAEPVMAGEVLAVAPDSPAGSTDVATVDDTAVRARISGVVSIKDGQVVVTYEEREE
ncbi:MAG: DNA-directed RNA polymerase subunit beta', partial [Dehalococcoidia bacterium]|nr:DNA-directed RNA polymerase subunit beta' [Dehalococcoidia bacterium]